MPAISSVHTYSRPTSSEDKPSKDKRSSKSSSVNEEKSPKVGSTASVPVAVHGATARQQALISQLEGIIKLKKTMSFQKLMPGQNGKFAREIKPKIKQAMLEKEIREFVCADSFTDLAARENIFRQLTAWVEAQNYNADMKQFAASYIEKKYGKANISELNKRHLFERQGGRFDPDGTTLAKPIIRSKIQIPIEEPRFFQMLKSLSSDQQRKLANKHGMTGKDVILGTGGLATVKVAVELRGDNKEEKFVAAKIIKNDENRQKSIEMQVNTEKGILAHLKFELSKSKKASGKHLLTRHALAYLQNKKENYIFTKLAGYGDCYDVQQRIRKIEDQSTRDKAKCTLARQYVEALDELHDLDIYHLDVKPDNYLMTQKGRVLLSDYGLATHDISKFGKVTEDNDTSSEKDAYVWHGTPSYTDPAGRKYREDSSKVADKYSLGVTLYTLVMDCYPQAKKYMLAGHRPYLPGSKWEGYSPPHSTLEANPDVSATAVGEYLESTPTFFAQEVDESTSKGKASNEDLPFPMEKWNLEGVEIGQNLSDPEKQLLNIAKQLMHKDPAMRPDLKAVLQHDYFKGGYESEADFSVVVAPST